PPSGRSRRRSRWPHNRMPKDASRSREPGAALQAMNACIMAPVCCTPSLAPIGKTYVPLARASHTRSRPNHARAFQHRYRPAAWAHWRRPAFTEASRQQQQEEPELTAPSQTRFAEQVPKCKVGLLLPLPAVEYTAYEFYNAVGSDVLLVMTTGQI